MNTNISDTGFTYLASVLNFVVSRTLDTQQRLLPGILDISPNPASERREQTLMICGDETYSESSSTENYESTVLKHLAEL